MSVSMAKTKVLMLSDHPLSTSGVGTQSRWLIQGLVNTGKYSFRCFGGAIKHDSYETVKVSDDFIIKPTNGFGDKNLLRMTLAVERPDVLLLFTDPRFFIWVWEMEEEIHQVCPIAYNHLWDNPPWPEFNRVLYESTDLVNCINWPTYEMVHKQFPKKTNYVPHAVPSNIYFPQSAEERNKTKVGLLGKERADHFIALFVGRNARRKCPSDIVYSFKQFLAELEKKEGHRKATLLMHTDPLDPEGPNLHHVIDMLHLREHVVFSRDRIAFEQMNAIYNICDVLVNTSLNEGFGLPLLEMKLTEGLVIANKTGGMTRQVEDHETGVQYGVALEPDVKMMVGNQMVPYIFEDAVSHKSLSNALMQVYKMSPERRRELGKAARAHAIKHYDMSSLITTWDQTLTKLSTDWKSGNRGPRWEKIEL